MNKKETSPDDIHDTSLKSKDDLAISPRLQDFNNAMESYVESLFGVEKYSNVVVRFFLELYMKDKTGLKEIISRITEKTKDEFIQELCTIVDKKEIEKQLIKIDKASMDKSKQIFQGHPLEEVKKQLFAVKQDYLRKHSENIEQEYTNLSKELEQEMDKYKLQKEKLNKLCQEKDIHVQEYREKI